MKLTTRLYLIKRMFRRVFTPDIRKTILNAFFSLIIAAVVVGLFAIEYQLGYMKGVDDMAHKHETDIPMCVYKDTEIRENPTGFILSDIPASDVVWVVQLQVPFAVVWYFDGTNWHLGTTTASYLIPCDRVTQEYF